jgi:hypothetical protein
MGRVGAAGAADCLGNAFAFEEGRDLQLRDGILRALEALGKPGIEALLTLAESGDEKNLEKAVDAFTALRTRPAADALPRLLLNPHLSIARRADLIRSYANYLFDPPVSLEPLLTYLLAHPEEPAAVKLAGLEVLSSSGPKKSERVATWLIALLGEKDAAVRLATLKALGSTRLTVAAPRLVSLLRREGTPAAEKRAALKALRVLSEGLPVPGNP